MTTSIHNALAFRSPLTRSAAVFEVTVATIAYCAYFLVRGMTESGLPAATRNADRVIQFERWARLYHEQAVQDAIASNHGLEGLANAVYIWGHWPVIIAVGVWLMYSSPADYRILRNAFVISGGVGLVVFATFPVAPPRLLDIGLVDTVTMHSDAYRILQPPAFVNQYAAMPSLHFGWDLLIGITLVRHRSSRYLRALGVLLPVAMAWAVVATANHFILDTLVGGAVALFGLAAATWAADWLDAAQLNIQRLAVRAARLNRAGAR